MDVPTDERELRMDRVPVAASPPAGFASAAAASGFAAPRPVVLAASAAAPAIAAPANTAAIASAPPPSVDDARRVIGVGVGAVRRLRTRGSGEKASTSRVLDPAAPADVSSSNDRSCSCSR